MLAANTILQSRYRIVRELGHGGMGRLYEAIDQSVSCVVALKETLVGSDPEGRRAFEREAGLLANLHHPSLPKVMHYFSEGQDEFLVMEFIPGHDLAELLELRGSPFPQDQVMRWCYQLLAVLTYLHSHNPPILHRDIKPANVKLTREGEVFLLDFGLAKGAAGQMSTLKTSKSFRGFTPKYAPLEQILDHGTDPRSDLYSLGATLYQLLTDTVPTDAPTRDAAIKDGDPDPLQPIDGLNPQVSPRIAAVIYQAMAMNRPHRPASAAQMEQAFRLAAEEDERNAAEEKYRRAEAERQRHDGQEAQGAKRRLATEKEAEQRPLKDKIVRKEEAEHQLRRDDAEILAHEDYARTRVMGEPKKSDEQSVRRIANSQRLAEEEVRNVTRRVAKRKIIFGAIMLLLIGSAVFIMWRRFVTPHASSAAQPPPSAQPATPPNTDPSKIANASASHPMTVTTESGIDLVWIPAGEFMMGSANGDPDEKPIHRVTISSGFYMGKYETTRAQWRRVMKTQDPSSFKGDSLPVVEVSWSDVQKFIIKLNEMKDGYVYRLPTEAEWEYACRAGTTGDYAGSLDSMAWYKKTVASP